MADGFQKLMSIINNLTDLVLEELLEHPKLKKYIDKRIEAKMDVAPDIPKEGFLRLQDIVKNPNNPHPLIPISRAGWYAGIKEGKYPKPVRLSARAVAWRREDIVAIMRTFKKK